MPTSVSAGRRAGGLGPARPASGLPPAGGREVLWGGAGPSTWCGAAARGAGLRPSGRLGSSAGCGCAEAPVLTDTACGQLRTSQGPRQACCSLSDCSLSCPAAPCPAAHRRYCCRLGLCLPCCRAWLRKRACTKPDCPYAHPDKDVPSEQQQQQRQQRLQPPLPPEAGGWIWVGAEGGLPVLAGVGSGGAPLAGPTATAASSSRGGTTPEALPPGAGAGALPSSFSLGGSNCLHWGLEGLPSLSQTPAVAAAAQQQQHEEEEGGEGEGDDLGLLLEVGGLGGVGRCVWGRRGRVSVGCLVRPFAG